MRLAPHSLSFDFMNAQQLIEIIEKAFDGVPQPEDITLHVAEAHDDYDYEHNDKHRKKDYIGRWQDIPEEHIRKCQNALSFVDKTGMRFYLPAYMTWYLRRFGTDDISSDHTIYSLDNHPNDAQLSEYYKERFSLFNPEQLRACALFVKYCADDKTDFTDTDFARKRYERHWLQYEEI